MKILFLTDDFPPQSFGGAGISTAELAVGMRHRGYEVHVVTTARKKEDASISEYEGVTVHTIQSDYAPRWRAWRGLYNPRVVRELKAILKNLRPDVVHINNIHYHLSYHSFYLAHTYGKKVIFTARDTMAFTYGKLATEQYLSLMDGTVTLRDTVRQAKKQYNPLRNIVIQMYLAYADAKIAVSHALKEAMVQNGLRDVEVVHTGIDVSEYTVSEESVAETIERFTLGGKDIILFSGRLSEGKGGRKVLEAFCDIRMKVPTAHLLIAGSDDGFLDRMRGEEDIRDVMNDVTVTGWLSRDEIKIANAIATVVVAPSFYLDPLPRTVIEAMAVGRPVVGSCYGGTPELIKDGVTGYIVNPAHTEEMAVKVVDLLTHKEKAHQFGQAGRKRIEEKFNRNDMVEKYISFYTSVTNST